METGGLTSWSDMIMERINPLYVVTTYDGGDLHNM